MTEPEGTPSVEQTREEIEALLGTTVSGLKSLLNDGGKKKIRVSCEACGHKSLHEVEVADADLMVKALTALSSAAPRLQAKEDATSVKAAKILQDLAGLTNAELAEYIAKLEAEIAREAE